MADLSTYVGQDVWGSKSVTWGSWTAGAVTTGEINTRLHSCELLFLQPNSNTSPTAQCEITTTLPAAGSSIGIQIVSNVDGYWLAIGDGFA